MSAADVAAASEALQRGQLTMTLKATEGERFRLRDLGTLCTRLDSLMREVSKGVDPVEAAKLEWIIEAVGLAGDSLSVTIGARMKRPRKRAKAA